MADSKDKLRPGITETRGAQASLLSGNMVWILAAVAVILLFAWKKGMIKLPKL